MLARHKSLPLCWPQRLKSRLHPLRGKTASDMVCLKLRAPQNVRLGSDSPKTLSQLTGCCGRPSRRHDGTRRTMAVSGRIHRFNLPARCLFFFVCYLMHLFLLVDSCSIPSVASKFRSGTLLLNLAMYCMFVSVYYIYTGWSWWPNSSPRSSCDSFQRWCITFSIPLGSASQDRLKLVGPGGFFHGNGWDLKDRDWSFRGVQSPACFMGKKHGETHEKSMISSKEKSLQSLDLI